MVQSGNIFADIPASGPEEEIAILADRPGAVVERIVSNGHASPAGFWCDQDWTEWVILLQGAAELLIEGEAAPRSLRPGDYVELPPHVRHRVERTPVDRATVWLAIHWKGADSAASGRLQSSPLSTGLGS
jgi:cupin 2 domain-containing protein